jgi:exodeoxyribonuclease-3
MTHMLVIKQDYNIAHKEIDLKNPKSNMNNAGFLPEERAWMTHFLGLGYIDTFRHFNKDEQRFTWWSYRPGVREKNIGWRLDYHVVSPNLLPKIKKPLIHDDVWGSDHCPVSIEISDKS